MPAEMIRTISYSYHGFILEAYIRLAMQAEKLGVDLWRFNEETGNSILVRSGPLARHQLWRSTTVVAPETRLPARQRQI
jgi:hypothetical protein